jgi:hypothetical protein
MTSRSIAQHVVDILFVKAEPDASAEQVGAAAEPPSWSDGVDDVDDDEDDEEAAAAAREDEEAQKQIVLWQQQSALTAKAVLKEHNVQLCTIPPSTAQIGTPHVDLLS